MISDTAGGFILGVLVSLMVVAWSMAISESRPHLVAYGQQTCILQKGEIINCFATEEAQGE